MYNFRLHVRNGADAALVLLATGGKVSLTPLCFV
jgi:hypothetical protein